MKCFFVGTSNIKTCHKNAHVKVGILVIGVRQKILRLSLHMYTYDVGNLASGHILSNEK